MTAVNASVCTTPELVNARRGEKGGRVFNSSSREHALKAQPFHNADYNTDNWTRPGFPSTSKGHAAQ